MEPSATGWYIEPNPDGPCPDCGHVLGPHITFSVSPEIQFPEGGVFVCPEEDCGCARLWGTATETPSGDRLEGMRTIVRAAPIEHRSKSAATLTLFESD